MHSARCVASFSASQAAVGFVMQTFAVHYPPPQDQQTDGAVLHRLSPGNSQYIYSEEASVLFAINPKVMSTSSKLIASALAHDGVVPTRIPAHVELNYAFDAWKSAGQRRFKDYTRVMFIRNPYARLYSAWTNKFRDMPGTCKNVTISNGEVKLKCNQFFSQWVGMAETILKRAKLPVPDNDQAALTAITWPIFLQAVLNNVVYDKHWRNQVRAVP